MSVSSISAIVHSTDHDAAVHRYELLFGTAPTREFAIPGRSLTVTVFPGISIISGPPDALAPIQALRATVFVDSVPDTEAQLVRMGWVTEGSLGVRYEPARPRPGRNIGRVRREHTRRLAGTNPATDAIAGFAAPVR